MYAVIQDGGREYRVADGDTVEIDLKKSLAPGDEIVFDRVLLVRKDESMIIGKPIVDGAHVTGTVEGEVKGQKIVAYKYKRRKGYHKKKGHRQRYTRVKITGISV